ncbi:MAG: transglycosylase domain-containing protein [Bacilli bacterium]
MKKALSMLIALVLLVVVSSALYVQSIWNPHIPALLVTRVKHIAAAHGGYVPLNRIPSFLQLALIATEDRSFYHNNGIDFEGIARAFLVDVTHGKPLQGGSTITEQLVKDIFLSNQKTIPRKLKQVALAIMLSRSMSKNEVLSLYLNEVYLGQGVYGVGQAAKTYFGRPVWKLSPAQCAILAGLPQAPSLYDPMTDPHLAHIRQTEVLQGMVAVGYITQQQAQAISRQPLGVV